MVDSEKFRDKRPSKIIKALAIVLVVGCGVSLAVLLDNHFWPQKMDFTTSVSEQEQLIVDDNINWREPPIPPETKVFLRSVKGNGRNLAVMLLGSSLLTEKEVFSFYALMLEEGGWKPYNIMSTELSKQGTPTRSFRLGARRITITFFPPKKHKGIDFCFLLRSLPQQPRQ